MNLGNNPFVQQLKFPVHFFLREDNKILLLFFCKVDSLFHLESIIHEEEEQIYQ